MTTQDPNVVADSEWVAFLSQTMVIPAKTNSPPPQEKTELSKQEEAMCQKVAASLVLAHWKLDRNYIFRKVFHIAKTILSERHELTAFRLARRAHGYLLKVKHTSPKGTPAPAGG